MPQPRRRTHEVIAPTITVQLDRERHLLYTFDSLARIEELINVNTLSDPLQSYLTKSATNFATVLWAGLLHEDPELDTDDPQDGIRAVRKHMLIRESFNLVRAINEAFAASSPDESDDDQNPLSRQLPSNG